MVRRCRTGLSDLGTVSVVEMEVGSRCNRRCSYCPVSLMPRPPVAARMSEEVFVATLRQLVDIDFRGRLSYHLYNEPLVRKDLHTLVRRVAEALPDALQVLNTNGDMLDERRYTELREAGIDYFFVTRHSEGPYPDRPWQAVQTSHDLTLSNRGGTMEYLPVATPLVQRTPCFAPSEMLIISVTGNVLLCYEDAHREHVLGNVLESSLREIWASSEVQEMQRRLRAGDRTVSAMCMACTNVYHSEPGLSPLERPMLDLAGLASAEGAVPKMKEISTQGRRR